MLLTLQANCFEHKHGLKIDRCKFADDWKKTTEKALGKWLE